MAIIGQASVEIRAVDKYFEADVKKILAKVKPVEVPVTPKLDIKQFDKELNKFRSRLKKEDVTLKANIDLTKVADKVETAYDLYRDAEFEFNATANVDSAIAELEKLKQSSKLSTATITADAQTARAEAQLALAARDRVSRVSMDLDLRNSETFMGMINVLTGTLPFDKVYAVTTGIAANFEMISVAGTAAITGIGALSSAVITLGSSLVAVGGDISQTALLAAFLPATIVTLTSVLKANKFAWEGFGTAAKDNSEKANKALAMLPPIAQDAAIAVRGLRDQLQDSVQDAFWFQVQDSFQNMVKSIFPDVRTGLTAIGSALGFLQKNVFDTVAEFGTLESKAEPGLSIIEDMLGNVAKAVLNATDGVTGLVTGFTYFAEVGASYLPRFGDWISELGSSFGDFAEEARNSGDMLKWMDTGIERIKQLGSILGDTGGILKGFYDIANKGGSAGLEEMADGFERVADIVNSEPYQSQMVAGLEGARAGAAAMGDAIAKVHAYFLESADSAAAFLEITGEIAGITFENLIALFDGTGLGFGLYTALADAKQAVLDLEPSFANVGHAIGDLGEIAGELFLNMAPGLNMLTELISQVIAELKDGIIAAMPIFNEFVQNIIGAAQGPVVAFADAIGNILEAFAGLPGPIQTALSALGLVLLLKPKFDALWRGIADGAGGAFARVTRDSAGAVTGLTNWGRTVEDANRRVSDSWANVGRVLTNTDLGEGKQSGFRDSLGATSRAIGTSAGQGLRLAAGGLMNALGGPWGLALAGATVALATWGQGQLESKERVSALTEELGKQSGEFNKVTEEMLATNLMDGATNKWDDFWRGVMQGADSTEETLETLGISFADIGKKMGDPEGRDKFVQGIQDITSAMNNQRPVTDEMLESIGTTREEFDRLGRNGADSFKHLNREVAGVAEEAAKAQLAAQRLADEFGTSTVQAAQMAANYKILESVTSGVSAKLSAFKQNLDIVNGGKRTAADAARNYNEALLNTNEALAGFEAANGQTVASLVGVSGIIDTTSRAGIALRDTFTSQADAIYAVGIEAFDAARRNDKSMEESSAAAVSAMRGPIDSFRQSLANFGIPPGVINRIMDDFGLIDQDITASLMADGDQAIMEAARVQLVLDAYESGNYEAVLSMLPDEAKAALGDTMGLAQEFAEGDYAAILTALDKTPGGMEAALGTLAIFEGGSKEEWTAFLEARDMTDAGLATARTKVGSFGVMKEAAGLIATDQTAEGVGAATTSIKSVADHSAAISAVNQTANAAIEANATLGTVTDIRRDISAVNKTAVASTEAKSTMGSVPNVKRDIDAINKTAAGAASSKATMGAVPDIRRDISAVNKAAAGSTSARREMASVPDVFPEIIAQDKTGGPAGTATRNITGIPGTNVSINALDNASQVARNIRAEIGAVQGKTVVITTEYQSRGRGAEAANGGIWRGANGVKAFADGGFNMPNVKSFANGSEKHVAQIAKGAWPYRIWAEPETEGEAYIPLAKKKRKRSMKILQRVAAEFGLGMFQKYADGGMETPRSGGGGGVTSRMFSDTGTGSRSFGGASGGGAPVAVNVYPSQGLDEEQIGESAANTLYWNLLHRRG